MLYSTRPETVVAKNDWLRTERYQQLEVAKCPSRALKTVYMYLNTETVLARCVHTTDCGV